MPGGKMLAAYPTKEQAETAVILLRAGNDDKNITFTVRMRRHRYKGKNRYTVREVVSTQYIWERRIIQGVVKGVP